MTTSFYPPYHVGGDATHVKYLAEALADMGHDVHVLHSLDAYKLKRHTPVQLRKEEAREHLFIHTINSPIMQFDSLMVYALGASPYVTKEFSRLINDIKPDIVHHHNVSLLGYRLFKKRFNYASIYTAHDYWLICQTNNLFQYQKQICSNRNCPFCSIRSGRPPQIWRRSNSFNVAINDLDLIISPSEYVKCMLGELRTTQVVIPNFVPKPPKNIPRYLDENYFLYLGMLERHKGILELLSLFKELKGQMKSKLVIAGGGSLKQYIIDYINKHSLDKFVSFMGFVDNKTKYSLYKNATAVIIPSIWPENAPLVALEALSVGTPVIGSNKGGLPEILSKFGTDFMFNNLTELKSILQRLAESKGSAKVDEKIFNKYFSPHAYIDQYLSAVKCI